MFLNLLILLPLLRFLSIVAKVAVASPQTLPNCTEKCGNMSIPYPFGVKAGCFRDDKYLITCEARIGGTLRAYQGGGTLEVLDISLDGHARFKSNYYAYKCFSSTGAITKEQSYWIDMGKSPFWFSPTNNKFTAIGCNTMATISESTDNKFMTGCVSVCSNISRVRDDGSCSGIGCCQTPVPWGLKRFNVSLTTVNYNSSTWSFNPCSFALLAEQDWFTFSLSDISALTFNRTKIPVVMDWAIGNQTCEEAKKQKQLYACGPNSYCFNSDNGPGYRCNCSDGFEGNPYLPHVGCQDIDECEKGRTNLCHRSSICTNTYGSYNCTCPRGYDGNGWVNGTGCTKIPDTYIRIIAGTGAGILVLPVIIWLWFREIQKAKLFKLFKQNGGILLRQHIEHDNVDLKIFSLSELKKATENFKESICKEENDEVFMGTLSCGKKVTIKRPKPMDKGDKGDKAQTHEGQNECSTPHEMESPLEDVDSGVTPPRRKNLPLQILNKVIILSQINHKNVVELLGCCLEYHGPILVYKFVSKRTLFDHIHREKQAEPLSWEDRLRIALETANALDYLYSSHSVSIFVTSSTILIDEEKKAKVSYFGASGRVPLDETEKNTVIQGARGYLDPEGSQSTDKSDVYSLGVVLAELLTGKKPFLSEISEGLAKSFVSSVEENNLSPYEPIENNEKKKEFLEVAKLAKECLQDKRDDRPRMKEVVEKLDTFNR